MRCYANIGLLLAQPGALTDNVVSETIFVTNMEAALAAVQVGKFALPELMIEIKCVAKV